MVVRRLSASKPPSATYCCSVWSRTSVTFVVLPLGDHLEAEPRRDFLEVFHLARWLPDIIARLIDDDVAVLVRRRGDFVVDGPMRFHAHGELAAHRLAEPRLLRAIVR